MTESSADVVIVGGGIAGMTAAYYLAKAGVASVVVERDAIGSHASGFAYGGLSPLSGFGIPGPQAEIALGRDCGRVTGVVLEREVLSCAAAVLALGPWSAEASDWIGVPIDVRPLKGQILRLQAPGPPIACSVGWSHNYATTKTDGLLWAGTTEEEAGFGEESTLAARDEIGAALLKMLPAMADAQDAPQTACLRAVASDGLLVLGGVPGLDHAYVATGGARKGILYGPAMGRAIADLVLGRDTRVALDAFAPGRFARVRQLPRRN